jgi:hypothetical protein
MGAEKTLPPRDTIFYLVQRQTAGGTGARIQEERDGAEVLRIGRTERREALRVEVEAGRGHLGLRARHGAGAEPVLEAERGAEKYQDDGEEGDPASGPPDQSGAVGGVLCGDHGQEKATGQVPRTAAFDREAIVDKLPSR